MPRTGKIVGDPEEIPDTFVRHAWVGDLVEVFVEGDTKVGLGWGLATDIQIPPSTGFQFRTRFMTRLLACCSYWEDDLPDYPFARSRVVYRNYTDDIVRANAARLIQRRFRKHLENKHLYLAEIKLP